MIQIVKVVMHQYQVVNNVVMMEKPANDVILILMNLIYNLEFVRLIVLMVLVI